MTESSPCAAETSGYIRVQDGLFVDEECKEFMFSGYNAWEVNGAYLCHLSPEGQSPYKLVKRISCCNSKQCTVHSDMTGYCADYRGITQLLLWQHGWSAEPVQGSRYGYCQPCLSLTSLHTAAGAMHVIQQQGAMLMCHLTDGYADSKRS